MKIVFKITHSKTGSDVYFESLSKGLNTIGVETKIVYFNKLFELVPFLIPFFDKNIEKADIIHSNLEYGWVFKRKNIPLVVTVLHIVFEKEFQKHTSFSQKLFHYLVAYPNTRKSLQVADRIIAISKNTQKSVYREFGKQKHIDVIYCGIDLDIFKPIKISSYNDNKFHLLFVGNLIKRKGVDLLPEIMKKLGNKYVLHYTSGLRTKPPKGFNLDNMFPLGKLSLGDLVKEYNKCDALLAPSRLEGFGYQIAEAMACGKPVIATNCSSIPELIINDKGGFLCEIDNINDFVEKIKTLSENKYLIEKMGQFNRQRITEKFNFKEMGTNYQKLYDKLLRN